MQAVLLFGAETWVLTPRMEWALSIFQHSVVQRLTSSQPSWRGGGGSSTGGSDGGSGIQRDRGLRHEDS